jgi:EAL domain-containing protein (putative c-di-GMP-specific phosphodiesterase class I)
MYLQKKCRGGAMNNEKPGEVVEPAMLARQRTMPRVCIADRKLSMRTFIAEALKELGFTTLECAGAGDLDAMLVSKRPGLVVIGSSAGGIEACGMVELLAARHYEGKVLMVGPRVSPMVSAVRGLGEKLGLAMLPLLSTPFGGGELRDCIAPLFPDEALPASQVNASGFRRTVRQELWYQPKIDTQRIALSGAEAIGGPALGGREHCALNDDDSHLFTSSVETVARALEDWRAFAARQGHIEIAVNLPIGFFRHPQSVDTLCRQVPDHPAFQGLIVEISAAEVFRHLELAKTIAKRLRSGNIAISIDNLGTQWPSLLGLHDFPFVELKVDSQLVAGCADSPSQRATCRRILELADAMGARTVADGVESRADFLAVREMGFHQAQGPLFVKPMTAEEFARTVLGRDAAAPK